MALNDRHEEGLLEFMLPALCVLFAPFLALGLAELFLQIIGK